MHIPKIPDAWLYPESLTIAANLQSELAARVKLVDDFSKPAVIAGIDVSNNPYDPEQMVYAGIVNIDASTLKPIETASAALKQPFPYRTGFLAFRETPVILSALSQLTHTPDILFVDGHGISHPRGLGIASHLGVILDIPSIGIAKSILVGKPLSILADEPGSHTPLIWRNQTIAFLLRSKRRSNPLIISTGHRISLDSALAIAITMFKGYRLPEPTRLAHLAANSCRLAHKQ